MFWLKDAIGFILQIVLVIASVLLFSYFDPFDLFNTKKLRLNPTSLIVESTRDIGELITAEYYGEVLATSEESFLITYENFQDSLKLMIKEADAIFREIRIEAPSLEGYPRLWGNRFDFLQKTYPEFFEHPGFYDYWNLLKQIKDEKKDKNVLKAIFTGANFDEITEDNIDSYINKENPKFESRREEKRIHEHQLVMLGRGWVKVGIDFASFDEDNFRYDRAHHKINLFRKRPEIISASINPWLSPEKHIRGFEMLRVHNKIDDNAELVKKVKSLCLEKLIKQAEEAGIMEQAIQNAETNLAAFFSLILDETVTVDIFGHVLEAYLAEFMADNKITSFEMQAADSLVKKYFQQDTREAIRFYEALVNRPEEQEADSLYGSLAWNYRSRYLEIATDSILDAREESETDSPARVPAPIDFFYYFMEKWEKEDTVTKENKILTQFEAFQLEFEKGRDRNDNYKEVVFSDMIEKLRLKKENKIDSLVNEFQEKNTSLLDTLTKKLKQEEIILQVANDATDTSN